MGGYFCGLCSVLAKDAAEHRKVCKVQAVVDQRDAALLQIEMLSKGILDNTTYPEPLINGSAVETAIALLKDRQEKIRLYSELQERFGVYGQHLKHCVVHLFPEIPCDCGFLTHEVKRVVPVPKKCESYWDGNQCELDEKHEGKHRFMGWTWLVSPPPQTCECGLLHTPEGHACGYWKPASGGLQS